MKRVVIESPFAGEVARNVRYARRAMLDSLRRGEAPFASHLLYTQPGLLDDDDPDDRRLGIDAGFAWREAAELTAFYVDLGWSRGMLEAREHAASLGTPIEERRLGLLAEERARELVSKREGYVRVPVGVLPAGFRAEKLVLPSDVTAAAFEALEEAGFEFLDDDEEELEP